MQEYDIISITALSDLYPRRFADLKKPPSEIFARGNTSLLVHDPRLGIVGTRNSSPYGKEVSSALVSKVAPYGIPVVSGLAYGIDGHAHTAAVESGAPAIAVLPGSVASVYPAGHRGLADSIVKGGGFFSRNMPLPNRRQPTDSSNATG